MWLFCFGGEWGVCLFVCFWFALFMDKQFVIDFSEAVNTNSLTVTVVKQDDATVLSHIKSNLSVQLILLLENKYLRHLLCLVIK